MFQSTLPRGERLHGVDDLSPFFLFQSTLPRGERLGQKVDMDTKQTVSIHAPARGATYKSGDLKLTSRVSIHAPARGATANTGIRDMLYPSFNPRSREGSDLFKTSRIIGLATFQSTLPRGERPVAER